MHTSAAIDVAAIKADFPILGRSVHGAPLTYLDSAATSQKPAAVLDAMDAYYRETNANVHRGVYELAAEATDRFEAGRDAVARLVGAPREGVILTKNASEAINLVAWAWGVRNLRPGDRVVVTEMEHHSNIVPWQIVAGITGAEVAFASVTPGGELDMDSLRGLLTGPVRMVAVGHASNVLGTINPVAEVARLAHDAGALCLVDGSQAVPHMPVDVPALGCDFYAFTGHKMLGPTGIGVLVGKVDVLEGMEPFLGGGEMISDVTTAGSSWAQLPWKFEAGTPPIAEAVGLGAAAGYLAEVGLDAIRAHEVDLTGHMLDALAEVDGITVYGPRDPEARGGAVSFSLPDIHPHDIAQLIDRDGVCVRAGHHCAKPLMRVLGVGATARASTYLYNSREDIDTLVRALGNARAMFK
ncbi:MAG TPA: SufS family cysteine desulfurase [Miltoncostaeaceae bacterium]|jgi:cysteine desulfurase/selenocysteine lyase|nr:SufS family cysteine desulfurase [Miltoncostaeaceae bacterium]